MPPRIAPIARAARVARLARSRARGSVIVETVVVVPLLVIVLAFAWWVYRLHLEKHATLEDVREPVWATASFACGRPGETRVDLPGASADVAIGATPLDAIPGADFRVVNEELAGAEDLDVLSRPVRHADADRERAYDGIALLGTRGGTFHSRATMLCNETVEDGRLGESKRITSGIVDP